MATATVDPPSSRKRVDKKKLWGRIGGTAVIILLAALSAWGTLQDMREFKQRKQSFVATVQDADWEILSVATPDKPSWIPLSELGWGEELWSAQVKAGRCELRITAPEEHPEQAVVHITSTNPTLASPVSDLTAPKVKEINFYLNLGHCYADSLATI